MKIIKFTIFTILVTGTSLIHGMLEKLSYKDQKALDKILVESLKDANYKAAQEALNKGADINTSYDYNHSARGYILISAILENREDIIQFLIVNGADLNLNNKNYSCENTPLIRAVLHGHRNIVSSLLYCNKVDPTLKNQFGHTALFEANASGYKEIANEIRKYLKVYKAKRKQEITKIKELVPVLADIISDYEIDLEISETELISNKRKFVD